MIVHIPKNTKPNEDLIVASESNNIINNEINVINNEKRASAHRIKPCTVGFMRFSLNVILSLLIRNFQ
jgi:hypothetical protein